MLRKILMILLIIAMMPAALGESLEIESEPPEEPIETDGEYIHVSCAYDADAGQSVYTAVLTEDAPVTAQDLLYSLYVYLDPGCTVDTQLENLDIVGLTGYVRQVSQEHLDLAYDVLDEIIEKGEDYECTGDDAWTQDQQDAYWALANEYAAECEAEFPNCAQAIVDYLTPTLDSVTAFDLAIEDLVEDQTLYVAYAMLNWGYASYDTGVLTASKSNTTWNLTDGERPTVDDFAGELSLAYSGDLSACWAIEGTGTYTPELTDVEGEFIDLYLEDFEDTVLSVEGISLVDDSTIEITLSGIDMQQASILFGQPVLSLETCGDADRWDPDNGEFGHPFGDTQQAEDHMDDGVILLEEEEDDLFGF